MEDRAQNAKRIATALDYNWGVLDALIRDRLQQRFTRAETIKILQEALNILEEREKW